MTIKISPNVMNQLAQINGRLQTFLTSAPGEEGQQGNLVLGTLTASRRNSKPFIVGFIPPDTPVNYIPIKKTGQSVLDIPGFKARKSTGAGVGSGGDASAFLPNPPKGLQKKTTQLVTREDLRQGLIDAYVKITGRLPTPGVLRNMWAHKALENGLWPGKKGLYTNNYNLGSSHAGGSPSTFNKDEDGNRLAKNGVEVDKNGVPKSVKEPSTGTYFIGIDRYDVKENGVRDEYEIPFHSFDNLADAAGYQISLLAKTYPGTLTAEDPDAYSAALTPNGYGNFPSYHQNRGYANSIKIQGKAYDALGFNNLPIASDLAPATVDLPTEAQDVKRELITEGGFTGTEKDPKGDRLGRNIAVDESRVQTAKLQTDALIEQINLIRDMPALIMLINPSSFDRSYENSADSSPKTRHGHVVHTWLERPVKVSCAGVTAGQYVFDVEGAGGLTGQNRIHSLSYGNLLSLVNVYKNNGIVFSGPEVGDEIGIPIVPFTIFMYYDNHVYLGSFDDFTVSDEAEKPYQMAYSFNFTVRYDIDLDKSIIDLDVATSVFS